MASSIYNHHKFARAILKKSRKSEPSLTIELFTDHWKFKNSDSMLAYDGPMRPFLVALRAQTIPAFLVPLILEQEPPITISDGCLIVEIHDYRPPTKNQGDEVDRRKMGTNVFSKNPFRNSRSALNGAGLGTSATMASIAAVSSGTTTPLGLPGPSGMISNPQASGSGSGSGPSGALGENPGEPSCIRNRVIMKPDSESLYETLLSMHQTWNRTAARENQPPLDWDDASILELEARILAAIAPPLCLDTSFLTARVANLASILTVPNLPHIASDGSFISRSKRREWMYGTVADKDDESEVEDEVVTAANAKDNATAAQEAEENARKASALSSAAVVEKLGIGKKDWNMLVFGTKKNTATSLEDAERKPFDDEFFYRRQSRTRVDPQQGRQGDAPSAAATPGPPERDVLMRDAGGPGQARNGDDFPPGRNSIDHGDGGGPGGGPGGNGGKRPKPRTKNKKKNAEAEIPEPIDVDQPANVPPPLPTGETDASGKSKAKPKPKAGGGKAKKRTAEEMNQENEGTVAGSPMTVDGSVAPTPTTANRPKPKKPTKKQQEALAKQQQQAAEDAAAAAAAAASQAEPPKKKTKKAQNQAQGGNVQGPPLQAGHLAGPPSHQGQGFVPPAGFPNGGPGLAQFNGMPMGLNMGNMNVPNGISEDDFLAAAEAFGAGGLDPSMGMAPMDQAQAPPINMPLQFQPQQGFGGLTEHMQQQLAMMQNGQNMSRQPGGGLGPGAGGGQSRAPGL